MHRARPRRAPLSAEQQASLDKAIATTDPATAVEQIQKTLDPLCLAQIDINPESRVKVKLGPAPKKLVEQGWRIFLVKVHNEAGVTAPLRCSSPNAAPLHDTDNGSEPPQKIKPQDVVQRWLDVSIAHEPPLTERLSGMELEYCILQLFSRDRGQREATLDFDVGQGTQDLDYRNASKPTVRLRTECPCKAKGAR